MMTLRATLILASILLASTFSFNASALVASYSYAINPGGTSGYVETGAVTYNTSPADWLTVSSIGVRATFYSTGNPAATMPWFDAPIPQGHIVYIWWYSILYNPAPVTGHAVSGEHRYTEAGIPRTLSSTYASIIV